MVSAADRRSVLRTAANRARSTAKPPVPVDSLGRIDLDRYLKDLRTATAAAVQVGNPEVATSQPVDAIHHACIDLGIPLVVDATMAAGRAPLPTAWDVLVLDGRSWGGGNDVSIVVRRRTTVWRPTDIETALRDGLGVPACAAAALTLESALPETAELFSTLRGLTDRLRAGLQGMTDVVVHGDPVQRLPHIVGFSALYIDAEALLLELDRLGLSVASGSACAVDDNRPSHVLAAMGALTSGNVRVTLPRAASLRCVERLLEALPPLLQRMRAEAGV